MVKVGIQLYSVRDEMAKDPIAAIKKVAAMGYKNLEVANQKADTDPGVGFDVPAEELNKTLSEVGAKVVSGHIRPITSETLPAIITYHKAIGNKYIGQSVDFFTSYENLLERCEYYNAVGKQCAAEGMQFIYHNHYQEFQEMNGKYILYQIMEHTDPRYVSFEVDTFWAMRGGADPIAVMKTLGSRIKMIHQKDFSKTAVSPVNVLATKDPNVPISWENFQGGFDKSDFCEIGTGTMEIQKIIDTANEIGVEYVILEQDFTSLGQMESVQISMDSFKKFNGIDFSE
ncbi:MAG: hypothetical protein RSC76_05015 [Oscillospiraceae bacterium]